MPRTAPSRARLGLFAAGLLLLSGCGGSQPAALKPMEPEVPADLCATVPAAAKAGLVTNSDSDTTGNPTAACSLRSPDGSKAQVRAVVTWVQLDDDVTADDVLASQCRAIDRTEFKEQTGFAAQGADKACAASGGRRRCRLGHHGGGQGPRGRDRALHLGPGRHSPGVRAFAADAGGRALLGRRIVTGTP